MFTLLPHELLSAADIHALLLRLCIYTLTAEGVHTPLTLWRGAWRPGEDIYARRRARILLPLNAVDLKVVAGVPLPGQKSSKSVQIIQIFCKIWLDLKDFST